MKGTRGSIYQMLLLTGKITLYFSVHRFVNCSMIRRISNASVCKRTEYILFDVEFSFVLYISMDLYLFSSFRPLSLLPSAH